MRAAALVYRQVRFENRSFWRNPAAAFFTFAFPLLFLVIFTSIIPGDALLPTGASVDSPTYFTAAMLAFGVISACYTNIAMNVTITRDEGILKRVRGTPVPASSFLLGKVVHAVLVALLLVAITVAFGVVFYDISVPTATLPAFLVTLVVGAAALCALGLAMTPAIPNADAAPAVVNASILPLLFISGVFIPTDSAPAWMTSLAELFPIKHFLDSLFASYLGLGADTFREGDLLVVAAWGLGGLLLAARFFSWEPRR